MAGAGQAAGVGGAKLGRGGVTAIARATRVHPDTIARRFARWTVWPSRRLGCMRPVVVVSG
jgi:hypothetical protein